MSECPQFQLMPQVVPIYQPQQPPPLPNSFPMSGQPIFSMPPPPTHFGYPPLTWSPIHQYPPPPPPQPAYDLVEEDDYNIQQQEQLAFNNNNDNSNNKNYSVDDSQNEQLLLESLCLNKQKYTRNVSNKVPLLVVLQNVTTISGSM